MERIADSEARLITVEHVTLETVGIAFELLREFAGSLGEDYEFTTTEEQFRTNLFREPPLFEAVIARYRGEVAGYAAFHSVYDSWLGHESMHISEIYVRPAFRAKYLAPGMYLRLAAEARRRGYRTIEGLVPRWNEALLNVYRNAGASSTEYFRCELKIEAIRDVDLTRILPRE